MTRINCLEKNYDGIMGNLKQLGINPVPMPDEINESEANKDAEKVVERQGSVGNLKEEVEI